ncbi:MAG: bifunctional DNA-formamidopyrimidine glycosylase/DNA-(apurinic or apyrimidinic site) lyase [Desulfobulbaceae bacterium]|nr:MAG: bifunctional DNA-formamidopyrimidine glycosylase/DNA-(apurinic or apyrimidinic site) lyase [Desulfobulbaceae bacterium]
MPELPEVEVLRQGLLPLVTGRTITSFFWNGKALRNPVPVQLLDNLVTGTTIERLERRAKYLLFHLDNDACMLIHLGMTGQLTIAPHQRGLQKHDHLAWEMDNGTDLRFNDVRRFGSVSISDSGDMKTLEKTFFQTCGPEPFAPAFTADYLYSLSRNRRVAVKNFIMDNRIVVGVGNIYANESLFMARINPTVNASRIGLKRWQRLVEAIRSVLTHAIECGGSTINDFIDAQGNSGYFQINFKVYGKTGDTCPRCGKQIRVEKIGGRATFYCVGCQK